MSCKTGCHQTRTSPILLPRTHWNDHPHFPKQTLLLRSHAGFRRLSAWLVRGASAHPITDEWRVQSELRFRQWQQAMGGHEHYEEAKMYPYLRARFGVSTIHLEEGHEGLHGLADAVHRAFSRGDQPAILTALRNYDTLLCRHLDEEENLVIPLLLDMSPEEFERYSSHSLRWLLAHLDDCKEVA